MTLLAYPGGEEQKAAIIAELQAHADADRLVKGQYWEGGKGCAVGCTIKSGNHAEYETRFGIPRALARLEDSIFEGLPNDEAMRWPMRFMGAIRPGADLSLVSWKFLEFAVGEALARPEAEPVREACAPALAVLRAKACGETVSINAAESAAWSAAGTGWSAAARAAWSAAKAAFYAAAGAESAAKAAFYAAAGAESAASAARSAARSAAESAARSAASAASAAWSAARSAAESAAARAESAESAASAAWSAAESAAWSRFAEKLIELLEGAPVKEGRQ